MVNDINFNTILVKEIQNYLINIKNIYSSLPPVYPTGVYDTSTRNAIIAFQGIRGLPPTGVVDIYTWNALVQDNNEYLKKTQMPSRVPLSAPDFLEVKFGDEKDIVYAIKIMLNSFNRRFTNYHQLDVTNVYDEDTERAVKLFQQRSMLPVTGVVDKDTWNTLVTIYDSCRFYR